MEIRRVGAVGVPVAYTIRAQLEQNVSLNAATAAVSNSLADDIEAGVNVVAPPVKVVRFKKRPHSETPPEAPERGSRLDRRG